jgi:hypothetical protein
MYALRRRGIGDFTATVNGKSITVDSNGAYVPSWWCLNFGTALGIASCAAPTPAEVSQVVGMSDIGPNASPALAAQVLADQQAAAATDCAANPQLCQAAASGALTSAAGSVVQPIADVASGILQTASDIGSAFKCGLFQIAQEQSDGSYACGPNYWLYGGVALVAAFFLATMIGGGSPRRYGR